MADKNVNILITARDKASKALNKTRGAVGKLGLRIEKARKGFLRFGKAGAIVSGAVGALGTVLLRAAGKYEQWQIAFETMTGSAEKAGQLLNDIKQFAAGTPFELPGLVESSKQLLALGFGVEEIIPTMRSLGDIAAGVGQDKLPTLVRSFGRIRTKGRASLEELNMMLEAGVPILDQLAKGFNVSKEEVFELVTQGKVGFEEVNQAITELTTGNGQFANLMEKQSKSFFGVISNIKDNITQAAINIGTQLLPEAKKIANAIRDITSTGQISNFVKNFLIGFETMKLGINLVKITFKKVFNEILQVVDLLRINFSKVILNLRRNYLDLLSATGRVTDKQKEQFNEAVKSHNDMVKKMKGREIDFFDEIEQATQRHRDKIIELNERFGEKSNEQKLSQVEKEIIAEQESWQRKKEIEEEEQEKKLERMRSFGDRAGKIAAENAQKQADIELQIERAKQQTLMNMNSLFQSGMVAAQSAGNRELYEVMKAGAISTATVKTYEAANKALAAAPPPWNFALAGTVIAAGLANVATIMAQTPKKFADGGIVPGSSFTGDRVAAQVNSGEMILNQQQQRRLFDMANSGGSGAPVQVHQTINLDGKQIAKTITTHQRKFNRNKTF